MTFLRIVLYLAKMGKAWLGSLLIPDTWLVHTKEKGKVLRWDTEAKGSRQRTKLRGKSGSANMHCAGRPLKTPSEQKSRTNCTIGEAANMWDYILPMGPDNLPNTVEICAFYAVTAYNASHFVVDTKDRRWGLADVLCVYSEHVGEWDTYLYTWVPIDQLRYEGVEIVHVFNVNHGGG